MDLTNSMKYGESTVTEAPDIVKRIVKEDIRKVYKMNKIIGSGNFGTVRLAHPLSNPNKVFAVKSIPRDIIDKEI